MHDAMNSIETNVLESGPEAACGPLPEFLLLRETHHRLMNSFALMAAYLRMESRAASGTLPSESVFRIAEMISAQSELHRCLVLRQSRELIPLDDYMIRLCRCLSDALLHPFGITCEVAADAGYLAAWQCERLGLVMTELVVNAVKHAFGGRSGGKIRVDLNRQGDRWRCVIVDNGCCLGSVAGRRPRGHLKEQPSVGSEIVESLISSLGGTKIAHSTPAGTTVEMTFPGTLSCADVG